jgi:hypothetical protein
MLEHVALHQTRFNTPGVAPDTRGILLGKQGAVLFASIDKLVGFFRILSEETPLDDLLPTLKILQVKTPLASRDFLALFHASSSYLVDRAARIARLLGGLTFTGSAKHFVKYRDDASPLGYDVDQLASDPGGAEFLLYADAFTQSYARLKEIPFRDLVFRLSPRALPGEGARSRRRGAAQKDASDREVLWLLVRPGLGPSVLTYLWRNRIEAEAVMVKREGSSFGGPAGDLLVRVQKLHTRMLDLFAQLPGIEVHRPIGENFVVEVGFRHPLRLESCQSVFEKDKFYVFSGRREAVDVVASPDGGPLTLVAGEKLIAAGFDLGERREPLPAGAAAPDQVAVALHLVSSMAPPRRVTATLVPWHQLEWLKKLVFAVPPTVLTGYRVAPVDDGLLVLGPQGVDGLPLGEMFEEAAPKIYVPVGHEFLPRVSEAVLTDHIGGVEGRVVVFRRGDVAPFAVAENDFEPLGRRMLGRLEVEARPRSARARAEHADVPRPAPDALVVNDPVGPLPLWSWKGGEPPEEA